MLSDHRAVHDAKCGRPQRGDWSNADTYGQGGGGYEKGSFFADVLYGRPLITHQASLLHNEMA